MSETDEPSMYQPRSSDEWPVTAIPRRWVESLFAKMSAYYGARFADLWRGSKIEDVQKAWGIELGKLTSQQMKAGVESLSAFVRPPTLPEFVQHCRQTRFEAAATQAPRLENLPKMTPEQAAVNLDRVRSAVSSVTLKPTAEWAFKAYLGGVCGSYEARRCMTDAIVSPAGQMAVIQCPVPEIKAQYAEIRRKTIDEYLARGQRMWGTT